MSSYTEGQVHMLMEAFEKAGLLPSDLTTLGQSPSLIKDFGMVIRGKLVVNEPARPCHWREKDGIIYFSVTSDGTTGEGWIKRLQEKGFNVGDYAKDVLLSPDFKPTSGVMTEIAVLRGTIWNDRDRTISNIRAFAADRKLATPNAEVACLIREMFLDKEIKTMCLWWIVVMHEPIKDLDGTPDFLGVAWDNDDDDDDDDDGRWLSTFFDGPNERWSCGDGFAFAIL